MEDFLKVAIEGGSFGVSLFLAYILFKKFIKKEVVEPIAELKEENASLKKSFTLFTERVTGFIFKIVQSHGDLMESVNKDVSKMNNLFTEATRHTSQAKMESLEALKKVNVLEQTTDKLLRIATIEHGKTQEIKTELQKLSKDMVMVKTKVGLKSED